jgi:hypothetical protein
MGAVVDEQDQLGAVGLGSGVTGTFAGPYARLVRLTLKFSRAP